VLSLDKKVHLGAGSHDERAGVHTPARRGIAIIGAAVLDEPLGAAGATGVGEEIIRDRRESNSGKQMRAGNLPKKPASWRCKRANAAAGRLGFHPARVAFLALDPKGTSARPFTEKADFQLLRRSGTVELLREGSAS